MMFFFQGRCATNYSPGISIMGCDTDNGSLCLNELYLNCNRIITHLMFMLYHIMKFGDLMRMYKTS
jgi:hypothetical protein